jgi:hypothetical protein
MHFRDQSYRTAAAYGGRTADIRQVGAGVGWTGGNPDQRIRTALAGRIGNNVLTGGWLDVPLTNREFLSVAGEVKRQSPPDGDGFGKLTGSHAASSQRAFSCIDAE